MKKVLAKALALAFVGALFTSGSASALLIDFTSNDYAVVGGEISSTFSMSYPGFSVYLDGNGEDLTFNAGSDAPGVIEYGSVIFAGIGDGIGLGDDEIGGQEILTVTFDPEVTLNAIYLLDLFAHEPEVAKFDVIMTDGTFGSILGGSDGQGFVMWGTNGLDSVLSIDFSALSYFGQTDFSLAGLDVEATASVPEPSAMLLFGTGLVCLAGYSRRRVQ